MVIKFDDDSPLDGKLVAVCAAHYAVEGSAEFRASIRAALKVAAGRLRSVSLWECLLVWDALGLFPDRDKQLEKLYRRIDAWHKKLALRQERSDLLAKIVEEESASMNLAALDEPSTPGLVSRSG